MGYRNMETFKTKIAKENSLCKYSDLDEVEDEQCFLLRCSLYDIQRRNLLKATALETNSLSDHDTFISEKCIKC